MQKQNKKIFFKKSQWNKNKSNNNKKVNLKVKMFKCVGLSGIYRNSS